MTKMHFLARLLKDNRGAASVEYGLILALIVLAMFSALNGFASESISLWNKIRDTSADAVSGSGG